MHEDRPYWTDSTSDMFSDQVDGGDVRELLRRGDRAFAEGRLDDAEESFNEAIRLDPFEAEPHERLSMLHWQRRRVEDALNSLTKALELDPNSSAVVRRCIQIFKDLGRTTDAIQVASSYLERNPSDTEVRALLSETSSAPAAAFQPSAPTGQGNREAGRFFLEHGEAQFQRGNLVHARSCFELALEQDPGLASAHNNLGVLSWQEGQLDAALEHFNRAFDINPEDLEIIYNSAKALHAAGQLGTAANLLRIYLGKDPQDPAWEDYDDLMREMVVPWTPDGLSGEAAQVYARASALLKESGDIRGAIEAMERALAIAPNNVDNIRDLAELHAANGKATEAIEFLLNTIEQNPEHTELVLAAGRMLIAEERRDDARTLLESALAAHPDERLDALLASVSGSERPRE